MRRCYSYVPRLVRFDLPRKNKWLFSKPPEFTTKPNRSTDKVSSLSSSSKPYMNLYRNAPIPEIREKQISTMLLFQNLINMRQLDGSLLWIVDQFALGNEV
jgi:hypothetical protein